MAAPDGEGEGPLFLVDAMSLAYRAYFALPPDLATGAGIVTNALHGFTGMLVNVVRDHRPGSLAVAFDLPGDTFRHEIVEDYKAGRAETPGDLMPQFEMIRAVLGALAVPIVESPGYEADDVLATLATEARDRGCDVVVVTGDRDAFQLVEDPHVRVLYNRRGVSDYTLYDEAGIVERTGLPPSQYPMLAALRGDQSDNLPGVPGVGEKTAAKLLRTYGDLEGIYAHLGDLSPKLRENLAAHEGQVRANARAIPLVRDVDLGVTTDQLQLGGWDLETVRRLFEDYELRTVWRRLVPLLAEGRFGPAAAGSAVPVVEGDGPGNDGAAAGALARWPAGAPTEGLDGAGGAGRAVEMVAVAVADAVEAVVPSDAQSAVEALRTLQPGLAGAGEAAPAGEAAAAPTLAVGGRWDGLAGRSPLVGVALVDPAPPGAGVWVPGALLEAPPVASETGSLLAATQVVGHGVKELLRSLIPLGVDCTGLRMDTEVAAYLLDPSTGDYGLAALSAVRADAGAAAGGDGPPDRGGEAAQLTLGGLGAAEHGSEGGGSEGTGAQTGDPGRRVAAEAVADALSVARLVPVLEARLDAEGLRRLHDEVERPLVRVLARMEVVGIRVDVEQLRALVAELDEQTRRLMGEVHRLAGHEFNVNSTPQLRTVLYEELGLAPGRKTKTGYSTDAATLEMLRDAHPIVDTLLRYREVEKLRSTYGESLLSEVAPDGRIHASFRQTVARTGRLSSERPNLHNIPSRTEAGGRFRRAFVPEPGWQFLVADYDQVELRVIAHLSADPGLVAAFTSGQDIHRTVASGVYSVGPDEVSKEQRDRAKMVSYGLAYGMEAFGLARRLSTGVDEATDIMERYFSAFPAVKAYMESTVAEARGRGFTRTQMGRKRPLPDLADRNYRIRQAAERQAMNAGIQGLAADLFKLALVRLDEALEAERMASRLVLQVHDEVIVEVAPGEADRAAVLTEEALTGAVDLSVPLKVTMAFGGSWAVKG